MAESIVQQQYDRLAKIYDRRWRDYVTDTLVFLKQWAKIPPEAAVLDVACGTGEFERLLLQEHPDRQIVGIDISAEMLAVAQNKLQHHFNVTFRQGSATAIPSADECFDVVVCASSFHYFDRPLDALAEMKRVLKPGGKLIILDWCKDFLLCRFCDLVLKVFDSAHKQCYTQQEFHNFLSASQFQIQAATKLRLGLVWGLMVATATKN
ncbi:MAG: methyltransferase domain-containing protein [Cyanosarcina radialis HA8281-LM2]|jgi:ubiquinone/menaquinone biosynthesis C-methylase UbiE|nr:methyltransferase domain-containing protein [Cyanosarcina radialis HA8281-LM2]